MGANKTEKASLNSEDKDFYQIQEELAAAPRPSTKARSNIVEFYAGRSVFITGASGFIGKVLIEKLLRTCPKIGRIFVLIRPKWNKQPEERLTELLACPLFDGVRDQLDSVQRVVVVEGDVTQPNLGLSVQNLLRLTKEVSVVFHSAATVKFDEPLKQSIAINIVGTKNMIEFCRRCPRLTGLVHVSTAYANCDRYEVDEHVYPLSMDPEKLVQMADWLDQETMQELKQRLLGSRPNTYTYTKALAEWLIVKSASDLPVVICRPSIVCATMEEPFKGWIDNVNGPTGVILGAGKGLVRSMYAETEFVADLVPVDKVINLVVTLGWFAHLNAHQKHLNESAESFAESLSSGGCSSVAGSSSAASTNGADDSLEMAAAAAVASVKQLSEAAATRLNNNIQADQQAATDIQIEDDDNRNLTCRLANSSSSSSSSIVSSNSNTPSLSGEDENDELEVDHAENFYRADQRKHENHDLHHHHHHHQHHHHHNIHQDDGYGSRSSDYAQSIASSETSSIGSKSGLKRHISKTKQLTVTNKSNNNNNSLENVHSTNDESNLSDMHNTICKQKQKQRKHQHQLDNNNEASNSNSELEYKLKQFKQMTRGKLIEKKLPEEYAEVPVFHCTSGGENSITWGRVQLLVMTALTVFPSITTYRFPSGAFTNKKLLDDFYRLTLHYIPGYIMDFFVNLFGGKPVIVRIYRKFDQAAGVLKAFTSNQWDFKYDNRKFLMRELMNDEDRRLFNCDIGSLDWDKYIHDYAMGVKKFLLKEPMSNLEQARKNLSYIYYRNLSLQVLFYSALTYCLASTIGPTVGLNFVY